MVEGRRRQPHSFLVDLASRECGQSHGAAGKCSAVKGVCIERDEPGFGWSGSLSSKEAGGKADHGRRARCSSLLPDFQQRFLRVGCSSVCGKNSLDTGASFRHLFSNE